MGGPALASCLDAIEPEWARAAVLQQLMQDGVSEGWIVDLGPLPNVMRGLYPMRCGVELLIERWRTECFELPDWPHWWAISLESCPAREPGASHSESFGDPAEYRCVWCGARPPWPVHECGSTWLPTAPVTHEQNWQLLQGTLSEAELWPHLCGGAKQDDLFSGPWHPYRCTGWEVVTDAKHPTPFSDHEQCWEAEP